MKLADLEAHYDREKVSVIWAAIEKYETPTKKPRNNVLPKIQNINITRIYRKLRKLVAQLTRLAYLMDEVSNRAKQTQITHF